jgi:ribonuclease HI
MNELWIDASYSPQRRLAIIGYCRKMGPIHFKEVVDTTCTRAELQAMIWVMDECGEPGLTLYTDCQTLVGLADRRSKLEASGFKSRRSGRVLAQADLYKRVFALCDQWQPSICKVKGHTKSADRDEIDARFAELDRRLRRELRVDIRHS